MKPTLPRRGSLSSRKTGILNSVLWPLRLQLLLTDQRPSSEPTQGFIAGKYRRTTDICSVQQGALDKHSLRKSVFMRPVGTA